MDTQKEKGIQKVGKIGRPPLKNARKRQYRIRLNDEEYEKILYLMDVQNTKISDILRKGVDIQYNFERFKYKMDT